MSIKYVAAAFEVECPTSSAKFVLVKLADNANDKGECWPSLEYIERHTQLTRPTIIKAIKALEEAGIIEVERRKLDGVSLPNMYRLGGVVKPLYHGSKATLPRGSKATLPEPSPSEPSLNQNMSADADAPPNGSAGKVSDLEKAFSNYNIVAEAIGLPVARTLTPDRRRSLAARLAEHGLRGWNEALERLEASDFCRGRNDKGWKADLNFMLQPKSLNRLREGAYARDAPDG